MAIATGNRYVIRMRFELGRDDNPPLFDELMKFAKGTKRLNRLRTLAHEGLVAQRGWVLPTSAGTTHEKAIDERRRGTADEALAAASNEFFGPAVDA